MLQAREKGLATAFQFNVVQVPLQIEHAFGKRALVGKSFQHLVFKGVLGNKVDDRNGARLELAPGAGDALLQFGGVPGQIAIDDHAGVLQIQAGRTGIGAEENAALGVGLEGVDFSAAALLRDGAGVPGKAEFETAAQVPHQIQHPLPFGKNNHFDVPIVTAFLQDFFQLFKLGTSAMLRVEDIIGVANHAHHVQMAQ